MKYWKPLESLPHERQIWLMRGAAAALQAIEARKIRTTGRDACYFRSYPPALRFAGDRDDDDSPDWRSRQDTYGAIYYYIELARVDPGEAPILRALLLLGHYDDESISYAKAMMRSLGLDTAEYIYG